METQSSTLTVFDKEVEIRVITDVSLLGLITNLTQKENNQCKVCYMHARVCMSTYKCQYIQTETRIPRHSVGIMGKFYPYFYGKSFDCFAMDHKPLGAIGRDSLVLPRASRTAAGYKQIHVRFHAPIIDSSRI